jgi:hypothetical protein
MGQGRQFKLTSRVNKKQKDIYVIISRKQHEFGSKIQFAQDLNALIKNRNFNWPRETI